LQETIFIVLITDSESDVTTSKERLKLSQRRERLARDREEKELKRSDEKTELTEMIETIESLSNVLKSIINHQIFTS